MFSALLALIVPTSTLPAAASGSSPPLAATEREVFERSNAFRQSQGQAKLAPDRQLTAAAQAFAAYMARTDHYGHEADGREPADRAQAQGYAYCMVAENIAMFYSSGQVGSDELAGKFVQGWIDSPGHRRNLLAAQAVDLGVGIARSPGSGRFYAVQVFGRPAAMRITFSLSNRSREALRYQLDEKSYALPPGMTRSHEQCTPPNVSMSLPGRAEPLTLQPANATRYRFETAGRGVKMVEDR